MKPLLTLTCVLLVAAICPSATAASESISHERLVAALVHLRQARNLAKGGAIQPPKVLGAEATKLSDTALRHEIHIAMDAVITGLGTVPKLARIDVAAHVHMARLKLTTNRDYDWENLRKKAASMSKDIDARIRKSAEVIQAAIRAT